MSDADILATARKRFQYCIDAESENRVNQIDDTRFYAASPDNGYQWPAKVKASREMDPNGARPCLTVNKLPQHVKQVTNEQRQNRPQIKVLPVDSKGDVEVAKIYNGVIKHIEVISDADIALDTACEHQVVSGEGYWRVLTDYCDDQSFDQDILIKRIKNALSVHMDPEIQDPTGADQRFCFITEDIPEEEFKLNYPNAKPVDWDFVGSSSEYVNWYLTGEKKVRIAEYFYLDYEKRKLIALSNGWVGFKEDLPDSISEDLIKDPVKTRDVLIKKVRWCKVTGEEILDKKDWPSQYIPVVRIVGNETIVDGKVIVSGLVRNSKDAQRMYNYWVSQETEMLALAPKAPFIAAVGQIEGLEDIWRTANTKSHAVLPYHPISEEGSLLPPPQRQMPPMVPQGIITAKQGAAEDIKGTTGQYNASLGAQGNETSGKAIMARQREGDVSNFHYIDNLSRAIRQTGRILLDLIPKIYDTNRINRIIGEDDSTDHIVIDPKQTEAIKKILGDDGEEIGKSINPNIGKYDVVVTVGPSYTSKRQEAAEAMTQMTQANPQLWQIIGDLLVKNMDWPGADEMGERLKATLLPEVKTLAEGNKAQDPKLLQAQQQIEQMGQQMEQMAQFIEQIQQGFEAAKADGERVSKVIDAYKAETDRMKALAPAMSPEDVQQLVLSTIQQLMTSPDISQQGM